MTHVRGIGLALIVSLGLHVGLALALRGLGFGPEDGSSPLFVDLVEPLVAVPGPPGSTAAAHGLVTARPAEPLPPAATRAPSPAASEPLPAAPPRAGSTAPLAAESAPSQPPSPPLAPPEPRVAVPEASPLAVASAPDQGQVVSPPAHPEPEAVAPGGALGVGGGAIRSGREAEPARGGPSADDSGVVARGPAAAGALALRGGSRGGAIPAEYDAYVRALRQRIRERLEYPGLAQRRGVQGTVELELHVGADGRIAEVRAEGPELLREAAIRAVRDATPVPFPSDLAPRPLRIRLPVRFELR